MKTEVHEALAAELRSSLRGEVIDRAHPGYEEARKVWNGLIDRHPAVIARCRDTADVVETVRLARAHRPTVSIRGGGHQVAGSAVCDDGLVIDLSGMKGIHVDAAARTVRAQAGVTWGELDRETQLFGLVTPGGEVSVTGIAGLTLGGGLGALMRSLGLSCDTLRSVEIVTADGVVRTASREEHPELLWAARGGGRGLGVVTSFEFDLHPMGPDLATAVFMYPYDDAARVLRAARDYALEAPERVTPEFGLWSVPQHPEIPEELHGAKVVMVGGVYAGPPSEAESALAPLKQLGTPVGDMSGVEPYLAIQSGFDEMFPDGGRYYWKSHFHDELTDEAIDRLIECDAKRPNPESAVIIRTLGGAIARVSPEESAFAHRSAAFNLSVDAIWFDEALDDVAFEWGRSTWDAMRPFSNGGVYVNFAGFEDDAAALHTSLLGSSTERLEEVRAAYDPDGLFEAAAYRP